MRYTADELLNTVLFGSLEWPGRTVRLERNSLLDYRNRSTSAQVSISELYHENSKLSLELLPDLVLSDVDPTQLRQEFLRRRAVLATATPDERLDVMEPWKELLGPIAHHSLELFYAIELRILDGGMLATYEPAGNVFRLVKAIDEREQLDAAVSLIQEGRDTPGRASLLFVLACFPRNEIILGQRGYRRTLLEAGQVAQRILSSTVQAGRTATAHYEFADRDVDDIMEVDGVEHSTVIAIAVQ